MAQNEDFGHKKIQSGQSSLFTRKNPWIFLHLAHNEDFGHEKTQSGQSLLLTRKKLGSFSFWRTTKTLVTRKLSLVSLHCSHEKSFDLSPFGAQRRLWSQEDSVWSVFTVNTKKLGSFPLWRITKTLVKGRLSLVSLHCSHEKSLDPSPFGAQRRLWSQEDTVWSVFTVHTKKACIFLQLAHNENLGHKKTQSGQSSLLTRKSLDPSPFGAQRRLWSQEDSVWSVFTVNTKKLGSFSIWRTTKTLVTRRLSLVSLHCLHEKA